MVITITHIRMSAGGHRHEHITDLKWRTPDNDTGVNTREEVIDWLRKPGNGAVVTDGKNTIQVGIYDTKPPHLQTYADKTWTDNLLALPTF